MGFEYNAEVKAAFDVFKDKLGKTLSVLKEEFSVLRAGRANPHVLDRVSADYYGTKTPIAQMSNITVTDARTITVSVWDASALKTVEKAILEANIGLTPMNDGKIIRLSFPELTEERRKDMVKQIKKMAEESKVGLRNIRRDLLEQIKSLKTGKKISEDEAAIYEKDAEKDFVTHSEKVDVMLKDKEKDLMTV